MPTPSRSQAKRLAAEARTAAAAPPVVDPAQRAYLDAYRPQKLTPETWQAIRSTHHDIMLRAGIRGENSFTKRTKELAHYLGRRQEAGLSIAIEDAMTYEAIDLDYASPPAGLVKASVNDRRSRLRKIAEAVNPDLAVRCRPAPLGRQVVKAPYSRAEELAISRVALRQRSTGARRQLSAVVGLCAGGGLDSRDLRHLRREHIEDHGDDGIRVLVPGSRSRSVMIRREYEQHVRTGIEGLRRSELILGKTLSRRNIVGAVVENAEILGDVPHIEASRLRATWLAWLMLRAVPLKVILDAAGLQSSRTLIDLLVHLPETGDIDQLRGEEQDA